MTISADGETVMLDGPLSIDAAGSVVTLEGLSLNGRNSVVKGITSPTPSAVHIKNCRVERFASNGIDFTSNNTELFVTDSVSRDNGGVGLTVRGTSAQLTVDNSRFETTQAGLRETASWEPSPAP